MRGRVHNYFHHERQPEQADEVCTSCGKAEVDDVKQRRRSKIHSPQHKKAYEKRNPSPAILENVRGRLVMT